jgi:hypothetical protein
MCATLDIDDDVLFAIKDVAHRESKTAGQAISELVRQALTRAPAACEAREPQAHYGFRPFPSRGGAVSNEVVNWLRDDEGL